MFKCCACTLVLCLFVSSADALCMQPQPRLVCAEFFREQVVVIAKLTRVGHVAPKSDDDYFVYTMQTDRVLRGKIQGTFRIHEANGSGRAWFGWELGETYVLFLSYLREERAWVLDGCGNSDRLRDSPEVLKKIEQLKDGKDGGVIA